MRKRPLAPRSGGGRPPKRWEVFVTPKADEEITKAARWIESESGDTEIASRWLASVNARLAALSDFPRKHPRFERTAYRKIPFGDYLILYRLDRDARSVVVCRLVHARRLPANWGPIE